VQSGAEDLALILLDELLKGGRIPSLGTSYEGKVGVGRVDRCCNGGFRLVQ
jgi:hypothetical protein